MKVYLVRHAKVEKRARWDGPDALRPLTLLGLRQARSLARRLADRGVERILSSSYLRCRQTVEPLAAATGLPIELHACLAKREPPAKAVELLLGFDARSLVCCTHAELLDELAEELEEAGVTVERVGRESEPPGDGERQRLAVLDMGSASFHLLVADVTRAGHVEPVDRERIMLRLGAEIAASGGISQPAAWRAVETATELRRKAERLGAERFLAVGTAALRDASNGSELTARIAEAVRVPVRLLSGEEEAHLIFAAFRRRVVLPRSPALGVDLGGGSLEIAVGDDREVSFECTLPVGAARLHRELVAQDPMKKREARAICERVHDALLPVVESIRALGPQTCVAAGGTARAMGDLALALRGARPGQPVNELELPVDELRQLVEILVVSSHEARLRMPGIRRRRADLLPTGALVLLALAESLGLEVYTLCDWGLREGVLLDAMLHG